MTSRATRLPTKCSRSSRSGSNAATRVSPCVRRASTAAHEPGERDFQGSTVTAKGGRLQNSGRKAGSLGSSCTQVDDTVQGTAGMCYSTPTNCRKTYCPRRGAAAETARPSQPLLPAIPSPLAHAHCRSSDGRFWAAGKPRHRPRNPLGKLFSADSHFRRGLVIL